MDVRVRCVTIHNDKLILIQRLRPDSTEEYYYFPGGGVDEGELPENACVREMLEEVSLHVEPIKLLGIQLHTDRNGEHCQMYYLVDVLEGEMMQGDGPEYTEEFIEKHGHHTPVTVSLDEFRESLTIRPGTIGDTLAPHLENLFTMPFFILDERSNEIV